MWSPSCVSHPPIRIAATYIDMSNKLLLEDAARSGLTQRDCSKLKFKLLTEDETKALTDKKVVSYRIPYFGITGKATPFFRIRYLEEVKEKAGGFAGASKPKKIIRYWQPAKALPQAYFPPVTDWKKITSNKQAPLYITEGEKKAAKACKEGLACIGLGGVWNWKSKKKNVPIIKDFDLLDMEGRVVILVFDSDSATNVGVMHALNELSKALTNKGAEVRVVELPQDNEDKIGLDDYLVEFGVEEFRKLPCEPYPQTEELWNLNEEMCFIEDINSAYILSAKLPIRNKQQLVNMYYANRNYPVWDGEKHKMVNAAEEWLKWKYRRTYSRLAYEPGKPKDLEDGSYNIWSGWGCEPSPGDITPWNDLLEYLFDSDRDSLKWFQQWLAYPLQHPGVKMFSAVLLYGRLQGTGKSFVGYIMGDIYGDNFSVVEQEHLHSQYNDWLVNKQFILGEEITGTDKRRDSDRIKNMLTREQVRVSIKYHPGYTLRSCDNYLFTSNHPDAMFLESTDRRAFVHEVLATPRSKAFYQRIDKWRKAGGASHLFAHLLALDTTGFNPTEAPPMTEAKKDMISLSKSDLDMFAQRLWEDPNDILKMGGTKVTKELFTIEELIAFFDDDGRKPTHVALSKALRRTGFRQMVTRTEAGVRRLWAIRNPLKWNKRNHAEWAAHYTTKAVNVVPLKAAKYT